MESSGNGEDKLARENNKRRDSWTHEREEDADKQYPT